MTPSYDLTVRPVEPTDRLFLAWTIRRRARADRRLDPLQADQSIDTLSEQTTDMLLRNGNDPAWVVLVATWRHERVGYAIRGPSHNGGVLDRYVDPWFAGLGIERALQEAVDLGFAATQLPPGPSGPAPSPTPSRRREPAPPTQSSVPNLITAQPFSAERPGAGAGAFLPAVLRP